MDPVTEERSEATYCEGSWVRLPFKAPGLEITGLGTETHLKEVEMRCKMTNFNWRVEAGNEMRSPSLLTLAWLWAELTTGTVEAQKGMGWRQQSQRPRVETVRRETKRHKREMSRKNKVKADETERET